MARVLVVGLLLIACITTSGQEKEKPKKPNGPSFEEPKLPDINALMKKLQPDLPADDVARIRRSLEWAEFLAKESTRQKADFKKINENNFELIRLLAAKDAELLAVKEEHDKETNDLKRKIKVMETELAHLRTEVRQTLEARLGVRLVKPSDTLVEQLDLPPGIGQVLTQLRDDSPFMKAGFLRGHVILLELDGKEVPTDHGRFATIVNNIKKDTAVTAVVMRAGKKVDIKRLVLP